MVFRPSAGRRTSNTGRTQPIYDNEMITSHAQTYQILSNQLRPLGTTTRSYDSNSLLARLPHPKLAIPNEAVRSHDSISHVRRRTLHVRTKVNTALLPLHVDNISYDSKHSVARLPHLNGATQNEVLGGRILRQQQPYSHITSARSHALTRRSDRTTANAALLVCNICTVPRKSRRQIIHQ